jgi:phenylpropionate dioxygenase-like ring-hydroxylating dioxygenase large terminal subunit
MTDIQEQTLMTRLRRLIDTGCSDGEGNFTAAAAEYVDSALYGQEVAALRSLPIPLMASASLPPQTTRLVKRLGISLLVTRTADGRLHVLKNRCRHRGAELVTDETEFTSPQRFVCPYHGWCYGLDGTLLHVPEREQGFPGLDAAAFALHRVPCVEFAGMVWIGGTSEADLNTALAPLADELALQGLGRERVLDERVWQGGFNWKLGVSGFLEAYHFKVAHKTGIAAHFAWNRVLIDQFGNNLRMTVPRTTIMRQPDILDREPFRNHVSFIYFVFPCSFISILPDHASFITFLPDGLGSTSVESHVFVPHQGDDVYWQKNAALFAQTITEDMVLAASIQRGIVEEPTDVFTFATFEHPIAHFHRTLAQLAGQGSLNVNNGERTR